jgi:transposase
VDETTLRLLCALVKCWMKRGKQKRIGTPGQQKWHHLIGAYNWRTGELIYMTCEKKNSLSFCDFLEQLMNSVTSDKPIVYVLDNASYHHSKLSEAMIAYYEDRSWAFWLPPYCSELNPIERYWKHLKAKACANRLFQEIEEVVDSVVNVLDSQNDFESSERFLFQNT